MSSTKKSVKSHPWFEIGDNGMLNPLPIKALAGAVSSVKKSSEKKSYSLKRQNREVPRIVFTPADFEETSEKRKKRKTDSSSIRKELFKKPDVKQRVPRHSYARNRANVHTTVSQKSVPKQCATDKVICSPLIDAEEAEEKLINNNYCLRGYPFKSPSRPVTKFPNTNGISTPKKAFKTDNCNSVKTFKDTPNSQLSNDMEFLELENKFENENDIIENLESPISSVCDLLGKTNIHSAKKESHFQTSSSNSNNHISTILNILEESRLEFENLKINEERRRSKIIQLLNDWEKQNSINRDGKENIVVARRSIRLSQRSPMAVKTNSKNIVSPVVLKSVDLRKSTLTKNLTKNAQINMSPKSKKAMDMYNSLREDFNHVLTTPKLERSNANTPKTTNMCRNLSRKVQNQCLMLQDTPVHK